jgi:tetratricopeptide (TPR) repeat protein
LVQYKGSDPAVSHAIGNGLRRVGEMHQWLGDSRRAEEAYDQAVAVLEKLAGDFPAVPRYRYELAGTCNNLGDLLVSAGRPRDAEAVLTRSLTLYEQLRDELSGAPPDTLLEALRHGNLSRGEREALRQPAAARRKLVDKCWNRLRYELAENHHHLGQMFAATDRPRDAEPAYGRAVALQEQLVRDDADAPRYRLALALMYEGRARLFRATARPDKAEEGYGQAQALLKKLADDLPGKPVCRQCLAENWDNLGLLLEATGRGPEAEKAFDRALELKQKLVADFPDRAYYRYVLAVSQKDRGRRLEAAGRSSGAEEAYRAAVAFLEKLANEFPDPPEYRHQLARGQSALGSLLVTTGRAADAERLLRQAQGRYEKLLAGPSPDVRADLAGNQNALALLLDATGRGRQAGPVYRQAVALWQTLADESPAAPDRQNNLGITLANWARLLGSQGRWAEARPPAERAVRCQQAALRLRPKNPAYGQLLREHVVILADVLIELGEHREAARAAEELVRTFPDGWKGPFLAADIVWCCAEAAAKDGGLSPAGRSAKVRDDTDRIQVLLREAERRGADDPVLPGALARFLALCRLPHVGDPDRAIALANRVLERSPRDGNAWITLGVALYRAGQWREAVAALEKAATLRAGEDGLRGFALAMAHWQLGDKDKAAQWYERAVGWMEKTRADGRHLRRVRAEAAALLGRPG